jgi:hypothetical protein
MSWLAILVLIAFGFSGASAQELKRIRDNSFLLEEAYNQESGVIQHIQAFQYRKDDSWNYTFTEEWPVPRETHQLSVTVPVNHIDSDGAETGVGDLMLNYRYQLVLQDPVALAPRLSLILPTGDDQEGLGDGAVGFQANIPLSVEMGDKWVTHWNLGATYIPDAKGPGGMQRDKTGFNYGASLIYLVSENFNLLVEAAGASLDSIEGNGLVKREDSLFINPGLRFAINHESGLQIVPGVGAPIGVGPSQNEYGVFVYLSLEHPAF